MMKIATCLILATSLGLGGVPAGAEVFGPNTVWGSVPAGAADAANAVLLDATASKIVMRPIVDGKFAFRDLGPGHYVVALQASSGSELARSNPLDLKNGSELEAVFSPGRPPSGAVPPTAGRGLGKTGWILIGAAAVGVTTAVVIIATNGNGNVASPSR
jgi:hypothetical protein